MHDVETQLERAKQDLERSDANLRNSKRKLENFFSTYGIQEFDVPKEVRAILRILRSKEEEGEGKLISAYYVGKMVDKFPQYQEERKIQPFGNLEEKQRYRRRKMFEDRVQDRYSLFPLFPSFLFPLSSFFLLFPLLSI